MAAARVAAQDALIIRGAPGKHIGLALGSLAFVVIGMLMLILPSPAHWSPIRTIGGGCLALLLGLAGVGTVAYAATRPILRLYPDRLVDARRRLTIPFAEIREVAVAPQPDAAGFSARWLNPQWLLLYMHDPGRYAASDRLSKRSGLTAADVTLDLSLASAPDCARAQQFIRARLQPAAPSQAGAAVLCAEFSAAVSAAFAEVFARYAFALVDCLCLHEGRECTALYRSPRLGVLLELADGAFHVWLGAQTAPFPGGVALDPAGASGWYPLHLLVEFRCGRRVYTLPRVRAIQCGTADPYQFEAELLAAWVERLLPLFETQSAEPWRVAFRRWYVRAVHGNRRVT